MDIEIGRLYQYKIDKIGLFFPDLPKVPFPEIPLPLEAKRDIDSTPLDPKADPWDHAFSRVKTERMLFLALDMKVVVDSKFKVLKSTFVYGTISISREREWKTGWVKPDWLELLSEEMNTTYEEEMGKKCLLAAREVFDKNMKSHRQSTEAAKADLNAAFKKIMQDRAVGPKK